MQIVSYLQDSHDQLAVMIDGYLYNTDELHPDLPGSMGMFLNYWDDAVPIAMQAESSVRAGSFLQNRGIPLDSVQLLAPVPFPTSYRSACAFRQHAVAVSKNNGRTLTEEFEQFPVFGFANHHSVQGPGEITGMPDHLAALDFELQAAIVICRHGRNIPAENADSYIAGLMIMNGISGRQLQKDEMCLNLGEAKGRDFFTSIGPLLVTLDELEQFEIPAKQNHTGKSWNLRMQCKINGQLVSEANLGDMDWTFAEIIERASYGTDLHPGDLIGSGASGNGCFLELNLTGKLNNPGYSDQWLKVGDTIEMEIERLGKLTNLVAAEESKWSILDKKK
ncbi:MAG TPA: fumarylacetoacetate hydrolase family protein [Agriterribacter sp.]|nr:fumarylacetoacetate hydrolase family protein [Agriterribacter sp.]